MRTKLSYKIFASFLLLSMAVVVLMIVLIQQLTYRIFTEHAARRRLGDFSTLVGALEDSYRRHGSWKEIDDDFLNESAAAHDRRRPPQGPPPHELRGLPSDGPPARRAPPPELRPPSPDGIPPEQQPPVVLLDSDRSIVAGPKTPPDKIVLRPIEVGGETVGWLGLKIVRDYEHALNLSFFEKQTRAFYITAAVALILSIVSALLFTRWIVMPIHRLALGTRAIENRDWNIRLPVKSKDELGELAESFNQMASALERHEQMRAQWISDISHELRTPLSILRGEVEAFQDGIRKPDEDAMDNLHAEVMHLGRIVEDMHNLTMADNGTLTYDFKNTNPLEVLNGVVGRYKVRFDENRIDLENDTKGDATVKADGARLEQLFGNLLENTLRYTNSPGRLRIGSAVDQEKLKIDFEDSAPGVPGEDLKRIFDRLYRVDKARSRATGGSGLGLAICKTIVEAHGGSIYASHGTLGGIMITIELPIGVG